MFGRDPAGEKDLLAQELWVTMDGGGVWSFLTVECKNPSVAEVSWMAVHPEHQGRGLGSALLEHVMEDLRIDGVRLKGYKSPAQASTARS